MEESLLELIRGDNGVADLLGDRVNWVERPQSDGQFPACVLQRLGGQRTYHTKGATGLVQSRVQIDVWAKTYLEVKNATRAIIDILSGYSGTLSGTKFQGVFIDGERDSLDKDNDANNRLFRVSVDAVIWHTE